MANVNITGLFLSGTKMTDFIVESGTNYIKFNGGGQFSGASTIGGALTTIGVQPFHYIFRL